MVAKALTYKRLHLFERTCGVILQEGYPLTYALYSMSIKFRLRRGYSVEHVLHICVVEQGAMNDAVARNMVEGIARHLSAINEHIVVLGAGSPRLVSISVSICI